MPGSNAAFSVTASGSPPLGYQWRFNGVILGGATNTNLTLTDYAPYVSNPVQVKTEFGHAQEVYAVLDGVMSAVLTQQNANIDDLLAKATTSINAVLKGNGS